MSFDIISYQGIWYEIAKFPVPFEFNCLNISAEYTWNGDVLNIINSCLYKGKYTSRKGTAKIIDIYQNIPKLKVSFDGVPDDSQRSNYWILYTDYVNYSIVGSSTKEYLWILSRRKYITDIEYKKLLRIAKNYGYDINLLEITRVT